MCFDWKRAQKDEIASEGAIFTEILLACIHLLHFS